MTKTRLAPADVSSVATQVNSNTWRPVGATTDERGYTWAWKKARLEFLAANPLCVMHEARGLYELANVVDHKIPHRGDMKLFWDRTNWQALCKPCHDGEKQRREKNGLGPQLP